MGEDQVGEEGIGEAGGGSGEGDCSAAHPWETPPATPFETVLLAAFL
ncbi:hypothetical protein [Streptomyces sp. NBC_00158]